jgi:signal peptidase I
MSKFGRFGGEKKAPKTAIGKWWQKARKNVFVGFFLDLLTILGSALVLSLLLKTFLIRSFYIPSGSMLNTLQINDRIIVNELVPNIMPIERGDVVVFKDPGGWLGTITPTNKNFFQTAGEFVLSSFGFVAPDSDQHLVKRVIGIGGDHVKCCDASGKLQINGKSITEPYLMKGTAPSDVKFDVVVPAGTIWAMGDNRGNSEDSRFHGDLPGKGFVALKYVVGRAIVVSWPSSHWQWLDNYGDVFKNVGN